MFLALFLAIVAYLVFNYLTENKKAIVAAVEVGKSNVKPVVASTKQAVADTKTQWAKSQKELAYEELKARIAQMEADLQAEKLVDGINALPEAKVNIPQQ